MKQLNIHITAEFEKNLIQFMKIKNIKTKSEALRVALQEAVTQNTQAKSTTNFHEWIGIGNTLPKNKKPLFKSHKEIWD